MQKTIGFVIALAHLAAAFVVAEPPGKKQAYSFSVETLGPPSARGSGVPFVSAAPDGALLVSWMEPAGTGHAFRFAAWQKGRWSAARTVAAGPELLSASSSPPSVIALPDDSLAAQWLVKGKNPEDNGILAALSRDGGKSWSEPVRPYRDATPGEHMYVSLFPWPEGGAGVVWLDPRGGQTTSLMHTTLGRDGKLGAETTIDRDVCGCCPTATAVARRGPVLVYRDHMPDDIRDIHLAAYERGRWSAGQPVHRDRWKINGCPTNAAAVSARGDQLAVAWFTAAAEAKRVQIAFSPDGGRSFGAPVVLDEGQPVGRAAVTLLDDGTAVAAWIGTDAAKRPQLMTRRVWPEGRTEPAAVLSTAADGTQFGFPAAAPVPGGAAVAWSAGSQGIRLAIVKPLASVR